MGNVAFHQAETLAAAGVGVTVFVPQGPTAPVQPRGAEVHALRPLLAHGNAACLLQLPQRVRSYDLIHLQYPFFGTAEVLAARRLFGGPPIVLQYQMDVVGQGWMAQAFRWHRRVLLPLIVHAADAIVVTSWDYAVSSFLGSRLSSLQSRVTVIPNGVDVAALSPNGQRAELPLRTRGRPTIAFVGALDRAHYFKGLKVLIDALRLLPDAALIVGGDGDVRPRYEAYAHQCGLAGRVYFAGDVPTRDLAAFYRAADVAVLPSVDRTEAFGLVLLEAMACGLPVVASRLPGVRTLVEEGRNGYVAEPGNAADLAQQIARCAADAAALGRNGRRLVEERYSWAIIGRQLLALYAHVLQPGTRA
jgi:glycosyltransferase involved in cell wall biosynthesis